MSLNVTYLKRATTLMKVPRGGRAFAGFKASSSSVRDQGEVKETTRSDKLYVEHSPEVQRNKGTAKKERVR